MATLSALLVLCEGNPLVTHNGPVLFDVSLTVELLVTGDAMATIVTSL